MRHPHPHELPDVDDHLARKSLRHFIRQAWSLVEPATPLVWGKHIGTIAEHLEAVTAGQIQNLLINVPPGHMKSLEVGVFWPAWVWVEHPEWRVNCWTYADDLAVRDSIKCRTIIRSQWYQERFVRGEWRLSPDQDRKHYYQNTRMGFRTALTIGGQSTGHRGDTILVDDPLNAKDAFSKPARHAAITAYDQGIGNRLNDMQTGSRVVIMQRLHEEDLSGHLLEQGGWEHLCLPSEYESKRKCVTYTRKLIEPATPTTEAVYERVKFREDWRTTEGELLFAAKFPKSVLADERKRLGSIGYPGQHQQRPTSMEGGMFKRGWWKFWKRAWENDELDLAERTMMLPDEFDEIALSWDCSFKDTKTSDLVAAGVWGCKGADRFLLDLDWRRMDFVETLRAFEAQVQKWPKARAKYVEDAANGPAIISTLQHKIAGIIPLPPQGTKEARAAAVSPLVEAGNVYVPLRAEWRDRYIAEHADFPLGAHDDAVDQQSQLLIRWSTERPVTFGKVKHDRPILPRRW